MLLSVVLTTTISVVLTFPESAAVVVVVGYGTGSGAGAAGVSEIENICRPSRFSIIVFTSNSLLIEQAYLYARYADVSNCLQQGYDTMPETQSPAVPDSRIRSLLLDGALKCHFAW